MKKAGLNGFKIEAYFRVAKNAFYEYTLFDKRINKDMLATITALSDPNDFMDNAMSVVNFKEEDCQRMLTINGTVETVTFKGVHYEMIVESFGFKWIIHSTKAAEQGAYIGLSFTPDDIHIMKKSYASPSTVESRILMEAEGGGLDE